MNPLIHYNQEQDQYELDWQQTNHENNKISYYIIDYKFTNEHIWLRMNEMNQTNKQIIHHLDQINNESIDYRLIEVEQNENSNHLDIIHSTDLRVSNISCFAADITFILCYNQEKQIEEYKLINQLRKNDYVRIYPSGYLPIKHIGYKRNYHCHRYSKWNNSFYEVPSTTHQHNLVISGYHSILVDEEIPDEMKDQYKIYKIHYPDICDKKLYVIGLTNNSEKYPKYHLHVSSYYHFVLDSPDGDQYIHYGVWANGILTESQNEHDFLRQHYIQN